MTNTDQPECPQCGAQDQELFTIDAISREWRLRGEPEPEGEAFDKFREWKRGFWAASMQRAWFKK